MSLENNLHQPEITIKAQAKHNAYTLILLGALGLFFTLLLALNFWQETKLVIVLLITVSIVITFIGTIKKLEPKVSFTLVPDHIRYHHKYGYWQIKWQDIASITQPTETIGIERIVLPYIAIRLHNIESIIDNISPRLASRLIHEQRPLIHFCIQQRLATMEELIINFSPFKINDRKITGPTAAFLHQVNILKKSLGYHLYIPESAIDRSGEEFVLLLRQCKNKANNYQNIKL